MTAPESSSFAPSAPSASERKDAPPNSPVGTRSTPSRGVAGAQRSVVSLSASQPFSVSVFSVSAFQRFSSQHFSVSAFQRFSVSRIAAFLLILAIGVFYLCTIRDGHVWGDDHAAYIAHARNIVEGKPYGEIGYLRAPTTVNPRMYPPGFPLLLAPLYKAFGLNFTPMKIMGVVFFCLALWLFYRIVCQAGDERLALAAVALTGVCPYFWDFKDSVMSEFPFLAFVYAALHVTGRLSGSDRNSRTGILAGLLVGLLAGGAYAIRGPGIVLVGAIVLWDAFARRRPSLFGCCVIAAFGAVAILQKIFFAVESDYTGTYFRTFSFRDLGSGIAHYLRSFSVIWESGSVSGLEYVLYIASSGLALYGIFIVFRRQWSVEHVFALSYLAFIMLFPWGGRRYLIPVFPFFFYYTVVGLQSFCARLSRPREPFALASGFALAVAISFIAQYQVMDWRVIRNGPSTPDLDRMVTFLTRETQEPGPLVFPKGRLLALYSRKPVIDVMIANPAETLAYYRRSGSRIFVTADRLSDEMARSLTALIQRQPQDFSLLGEFGEFRVFRLAESAVVKQLPTQLSQFEDAGLVASRILPTFLSSSHHGSRDGRPSL